MSSEQKDYLSIVKLFFESQDLDIRKKSQDNRRFMDQKVTPDILRFISSNIINNFSNKDFTVKDLLKNKEFCDEAEDIFNKPRPDLNNSTMNEYNKIVCQPLKTLSYCGVLGERKSGKKLIYNISNFDVLEYISINDNAAIEFLYLYLTKIFKDSDFDPMLSQYYTNVKIKKLEKRAFDELKKSYENFIHHNTNIKGQYEPRRIFSKILNVLAFKNKVKGTEKGRLSKARPSRSDLLYNRENFRDKEKPKNLTREEFDLGNPSDSESKKNERDFNRHKKYLLTLFPHGEVSDRLSMIGKTESGHVHHIIPRHEDSSLIASIENLIVLSPGQHLSFAHPNAKTAAIDPKYQALCFASKFISSRSQVEQGLFDIEKFTEIIESQFPELIMDQGKTIDQLLIDYVNNLDPEYILSIGWKPEIPK